MKLPQNSSAYRLGLCALCAFVGLALQGYGQELEISVSPSPVGSGARAAGMADAFVAVADDATAASWNPAGLVQLERPELSIVGSYNGILETFSALGHDEVDANPNDSNFDLNYLSFAYPLPFLLLDRNVCVSLNYQRKYDFSRKFKLQYDTHPMLLGLPPIDSFLRMDYEQQGGLSTITPACAIEITNRLAVGLSLNLWRPSFLSDNGWEQHTRTDLTTYFGPMLILNTLDTREEYSDFSGENLVAGILWNVTDQWNLGARYDTAFTGKVDFSHSAMRRDTTLPNWTTPYEPYTMTTEIWRETRHVSFPATAAIGAAFRVNDRLTVSLDVTRTDWNDFYVKDATGARFSLVDFSNLDDPLTKPHFDATYTVRIGTEYVFVPKRPDEEMKNLWTVRAGIFYDEEPATGKPNDLDLPHADVNGSGKPDKFYGAAIGCGLLTHQRVNIDVAYQLRYGDNVNRDYLRGVTGFNEDVLQHRVLLSTVIYF